MKPIETTKAVDEPKPLVLYVEDEDDNWAVTELRLSKKFQLVRAKTDVEAITAVRRFGTQLHTILMDIQLSGSTLSGIQLTQLFRGTLRDEVPQYAKDCPRVDAPIIFVTAYNARYTEDDLKKAGGESMVSKPVDFVALNLSLASARARRALDAFSSTAAPKKGVH